MTPVGFFSYGGMIAIQTLWAGPWMVRVAGYEPLEAATGLFIINVSMLCTFWSWGMLNPWLARKGMTTESPDRPRPAAEFCRACCNYHSGTGGRSGCVGAFLHQLHVRVASPAGGRHGVFACPRRTRPVGL